jgi:pantothenate kinase-related protein Tda10
MPLSLRVQFSLRLNSPSMQQAMTLMPDPPQHKLIIAIDGPAGAGKSTIASRLARKLGYVNLENSLKIPPSHWIGALVGTGSC